MIENTPTARMQRMAELLESFLAKNLGPATPARDRVIETAREMLAAIEQWRDE
jgi:hypothetical protein